MTKVIDYANSLIGLKVTVPTNPYGGQCIAFVDHLTQHFTKQNLSYTNAIDLLSVAKSKGFKETRFTGSEVPKVGDIWVTATSNHPFGHTGIVKEVDKTGTYFTTLEQNVDLNADALQNGGWVREKKRTLYVDGTFTYDNDPDGLIPQTMLGWFTFYEEKLTAKVLSKASAVLAKAPKLTTINHNGDEYAGVTTNFNDNPMYSNLSKGVENYPRKTIDRIVIHHNMTTNKNVAMATWYESNGNWTSAHYEVADNEIWGCVGEQFVAFHAGNKDINQRSIGIEHLNNVGAPAWTISEKTYKSSAKLIADICERYNIPIDREHIIGHKEASATECPAGIDIDKLIKLAKAEMKTETEEDDMANTLELFTREDGKVFYINLTEGTYYHVPNPKALNTIKNHYKFRFKKDIYNEKVTKAKFNDYVKAFGLKEKVL